MNASEEIKRFLNFLEEAKKDYDSSYQAVGIEDKRSQDLLHAIEFEHLSENWDGLCRKLKWSRMERRRNKDIVENLQPIYDFLNDSRNEKTLNLLPQVLGSVRKIEERHQNRSYIPRVENDVVGGRDEQGPSCRTPG